MDWQEVTRFGLPTFILAAVALALWRFSAWFGPKADTVIAKHVELIDTLKTQLPAQTELAREQLKVTENMRDVLLSNQTKGFDELAQIRQRLAEKEGP